MIIKLLSATVRQFRRCIIESNNDKTDSVVELEATWHRKSTKDHAIAITGQERIVGVVWLCGFCSARNTGVPSPETV